MLSSCIFCWKIVLIRMLCYLLSGESLCREHYYQALCTNCRPMMMEPIMLCYHRPAMRAESLIIMLSACIAGLWWQILLCSVITGPQCVQRARYQRSLHALQAYDDGFLLKGQIISILLYLQMSAYVNTYAHSSENHTTVHTTASRCPLTCHVHAHLVTSE